LRASKYFIGFSLFGPAALLRFQDAVNKTLQVLQEGFVTKAEIVVP